MNYAPSFSSEKMTLDICGENFSLIRSIVGWLFGLFTAWYIFTLVTSNVGSGGK
jgi:hypothetical protein